MFCEVRATNLSLPPGCHILPAHSMDPSVGPCSSAGGGGLLCGSNSLVRWPPHVAHSPLVPLPGCLPVPTEWQCRLLWLGAAWFSTKVRSLKRSFGHLVSINVNKRQGVCRAQWCAAGPGARAQCSGLSGGSAPCSSALMSLVSIVFVWPLTVLIKLTCVPVYVKPIECPGLWKASYLE